ncbi:hypothetical protein [Stenotrophomonas maltophilia]|uniref:hypothetical protein n=1 Tax=Stenotrophomonas maltophilia TaxID=40324 RepID=UPI0013DD1CC3|nr:hypothetical protein [Stenotrophomonas maltophilia]
MSVRTPIIYNPATGRLEELGAADTIAGTEIEGLMGRNRFINGDMRIWQRGVSFSASGGVGKLFCTDRWFVERNISTMACAKQDTSASDRAVVGPLPSYMRVTVSGSSGGSHYALLGQDVEDVFTFSGQTLVVSGWFRAQSTMNINLEALQITNGGGGNPAFKSASQQVTTTWQYLSFVLQVDALTANIGAGSRLRLRFWLSGGTDWASSTNVGSQNGWFDFTALQAEQGVVASPFERRFDAVEMLMCQRYFEILRIGGTCGAISAQNQVLGFHINWKVPKRGTPSVALVAGSESVTAFPPGLAALNDTDTIGTIAFKMATGPSSNAGWYQTIAVDAEF